MTADNPGKLVRGLGLREATALNMIEMIGVGPFITIPLILAAMGGPQAMLGWILGALLSVCDGLTWAELGAALPGSGGSYHFLREIYGRERLGRLIAFLYIWQLSFSAPLSIASGSIGLARYAAYFFPSVDNAWAAYAFALPIPLLGAMEVKFSVSGAALVGVGVCAVAVFLLYRGITVIGRLSKLLWIGVMGTIAWVIFAGLTHFDASRAFDFPPGAFTLDNGFFLGLGAAMLVAAYDYWGYYNVCFFADEVEDPARNVPRALLLSIAAVSVIYIVMNISILGVLPWRELAASAGSDSRYYILSTFMERIYGGWAGKLVTVLVMWTAFASVFSLLLGYSRVPYAGALDGNYFKIMGRVHPRHRIPHISLLALGFVAAIFCFLRLADVIAALVVIRISLQFLVQTVGLIVLRVQRPELERPFRMWLYPLPALVAIAGFVFILFKRVESGKELRYTFVLVLAGLAIFAVRSWRERSWPFQPLGG